VLLQIVGLRPPAQRCDDLARLLFAAAAGQALDLINIMAYDAGTLATTGFNHKQSYKAHR
jgi:hypothetical protein